MAEWKLSRFVHHAIGWINSEARGEMETHYKDLKKEYLTSQNYISCLAEPSKEEIENLFKEIYSNMALFNKLFSAHETITPQE
jgi:hypothetical protein